MHKQELVHLHTLCVLVRAHVEARGDVPPDAFASYDDLDVSASAIYRSKSAHRRAVRRLASDIASVVDEDSRSAPGLTVTDGTSGDGDDAF